MKIWIGEHKHLIVECIEIMKRDLNLFDSYCIIGKIKKDPKYSNYISYLYTLADGCIGSGDSSSRYNNLTKEGIDVLDFIKQHNPPKIDQQAVDISNTKIWIGEDKELSRKVQERAFELGYNWAGCSGEQNVFEAGEENSLYFKNKKISRDSTNSNGRKFFDEEKSKEITYGDMFEKPLLQHLHKEDVVRWTEAYSPDNIKHIMCGCDIGQGKDYSTKSFFDKLRGNTWIECKNEDNFIQPSHLRRTQPCTKQIPSWEGKLYTMPKEEGMKLAPKIKAKRVWEIL